MPGVRQAALPETTALFASRFYRCQQCLGLQQIRRVQAFGEPAVYRRQELTGRGPHMDITTGRDLGGPDRTLTVGVRNAKLELCTSTHMTLRHGSLPGLTCTKTLVQGHGQIAQRRARAHPDGKVDRLLLEPRSCPGKDKARVFASVLGITRDRAHELADLVRHAARDGDITQEASTVWGQYYRVDWAMPARVDVVLRTIWEIAPGAEIPRLVSVFIR